jgi:hypothetical protein
LNTKRPRQMTLEINVLVWNRHKNVAGLNRLIRSQPSPLDNWVSNGNTYINKYLKQTFTDSLPLKKTTYYHKTNKCYHKHGQNNSESSVRLCLSMMCNQCLSPLKMRVRTQFMTRWQGVLDTTLCDSISLLNMYINALEKNQVLPM